MKWKSSKKDNIKLNEEKRRKESGQEEEKTDMREITIKVIDTPHGPVPHVSALVSLVEAWNNTLIELNIAIKEIAEKIVEIRDSLMGISMKLNELVLNVNKLARKIDKLSEKVDEIGFGNYGKEMHKSDVKEKAKKALDEFI